MSRGKMDTPAYPVAIESVDPSVSIPVTIPNPMPVTGSVIATPPLIPPHSITPKFKVVSGGDPAWVKGANVRSLTLVVLVASAANGMVITTADGAQTAIEVAGFSMSWGVDGESTLLNGGVFSFLVSGTGKVAVGWTE